MARQSREKEHYACCGIGFSTKTEFEKHQAKLHAGTASPVGSPPEHGGTTTGTYEPVSEPGA